MKTVGIDRLAVHPSVLETGGVSRVRKTHRPRGLMAIMRVAGVAGCTVLMLDAPLEAQSLERTRLMDPPQVGLPWILEFAPEFRFTRDAGAQGVQLRTTFDIAMGLPGWLLTGVRYTPQSAVVPGEPDEWELHGRYALLAQPRGAPVDLTLQAALNGAATSADAELVVGRWFGGVRVLGAGRLLTDAYGSGTTRGAVAGGIVVHPRPRNMPISVSVDAASLLDRDGEAGERVAWSAALNVGVSFTPHTLSIFATNTPSASLQGRTIGDSRTRIGFAVTGPIAIGQLIGTVTSRERAMDAVAEEPASGGADLVSADIFRYAFPQYRMVVEAGTTIEWTNRDEVVHTVSADNGSWDSGAIQPGGTWRARFDEPGIYPYHCGPHPFMKGVVIVR